MANFVFAPAIARLNLALAGGLLLVAALLGGSSLQGLDGHLVIQFLGALVLTVGIMVGRPVPVGQAVWMAMALVVATMLIGLAQLVPLPLGGAAGSARTIASQAWALLGLQGETGGLSLSPSETVSAVLAFIPALAVFFILATSRWSRTIEPVCWLLMVLGAFTALLGIAQAFLGPTSPLHLYGRSSLPTGVFSNPNHQASFLVMVLPVAIAMLIEQRRSVQSRDSEIGVLIAAAGLLLAILFGIISTGSGAGLALLTAVLPLSALLLLKRKKDERSLLVPFAFVIVTLVGVAAVLVSPVLPTSFFASQMGEAARPAIWDKSLKIAVEHLPYGTGFGSFEFVYPLYESEEGLTGRYVNAAHNDYLQTLVELGIPGVIILVASLALWLSLSLKAWMGKGQGEARLRKAASIATLVVILHSLIDYPLRAPFYAMTAAAMFAILAAPDRHIRRRKEEPGASDKRVTL